MTFCSEGMLHGDINNANILVGVDDPDEDWTISGVIDFGDAQYGLHLYEIAVCLAHVYISFDWTRNYLREVENWIVSGFCEHISLSTDEINLVLLMATVRVLCINIHTSREINKNPSNEYAKKYLKWDLLELLISKLDLSTL